MEFYKKYIKFLSLMLIALSFSLSVYADEHGKESSDFESAMRKVLAHGNLADTNYLSKSIGLTVLIPSKIEAFQSYGIIYRYPYFFSGADASYFIRSDENGRVNRIDIRFVPNKCPNLREWGKIWHRRVGSEVLLHAMGSSEKIMWGGKGSISVASVSYSTGGECEIYLSQKFKNPISLFPSAEIPKVSVKHVINKIGELLVIKDFRDRDKINEIINRQSAEYPSSLPSKFWAKKSNSNINLNTWILQGMYISVNDSGWDSDHDWMWTPKHMAERVANFNLPIDTRQVCVTESDLRTELIQRDIEYGDMHDGSLEFNFTGVNRIKINIWFKDGCISGMETHQLTDVVNTMARPVIFGVDFSLVSNGNDLTSQANIQIDKLINSLIAGRIEKINLYKNVVNPNSDAEKLKVEKVANLLRSTLISKGIEENYIFVYDTVNKSLLYKWKTSTEISAVFIDPLIR